MASSYTSNLRFTLQATGENLNTWGNILNSGVFQLVDTAITGRYSTNSSLPILLTSVQGAADQARNAILDITGGTGVTITAPSVSKIYFVRNASSGDVVITTSGGAVTATLKAGERLPVFGDGSNFYRLRFLDMQGERLQNLATPTAASDAVTKQYADGLAFASTNLPGINAGTAGMTVANNGSTAYWDFDSYQGRTTYASGRTVVLGDRNKWLEATGPGNFTLSAATDLKSKFDTILSNAHTAAITVGVTGADTIDGRSSITLAPGDRVRLVGDGVSAFQILAYANINAGPHVIVQDQKASGTDGGGSVASAYQTRTLNTPVRNVVGASLASNAVTLFAGTWRIEARAPGYAINTHRIRLYNQTDATTVALGTSSAAPSNTVTDSTLVTTLTISSAKAVRIDHWISSAVATVGLGVAVASGDVEIYSSLTATRMWP